MATPARASRADRRKNESRPWRLAALFGFASCFVLFGWSTLVDGKQTGAGLVLIPVLFALTAPYLVRSARGETRFDLAGIVATGLALRFVFSYHRWSNAVDANVYQRFGAELAESFRVLQFDVDTSAPVPGTGGLRYLNGLSSVLTGSNMFANFLVFTWLAFWGCVLFYKAFVIALPDADHRRYALLIFLWPSLAFWPSSIGKESWMVFTLGLATLGAARVFRRQSGGYVLLTLGLLGGSFVRPHVTLLLLLAFAIGLFIGRRTAAPRGEISAALIGKIVGLVIVIAIGGVLVSRTQSVLDVGDNNTSAGVSIVDQGLDRIESQTERGGSEFDAADPQSPTGYPVAAVTVLFRPFPFEASGLEQVLATTEGLVLLILAAASWRRLWALRRRLRDQPYYSTAIAYILMFVFAFGTLSNFGILARQRVQLLPYVFVILAAPAVVEAVRGRRTRDERPLAS